MALTRELTACLATRCAAAGPGVQKFISFLFRMHFLAYGHAVLVVTPHESISLLPLPLEPPLQSKKCIISCECLSLEVGADKSANLSNPLDCGAILLLCRSYRARIGGSHSNEGASHRTAI